MNPEAVIHTELDSKAIQSTDNCPVVNNSSSTVEFVDESWLFTTGRSTVTLSLRFVVQLVSTVD